jgi:hypothetical protein
MSTLWTPEGERPIRREPPAGEAARGPATDEGAGPPLTEEEAAARVAELEEELAKAPVEEVVANHAFGLFQLAALHLGHQPPQFEQARLAIDALGALVEALPGRLGAHEPELTEGLGQLRLAFVRLKGMLPDAAAEPGAGAGDATA